MPNKELIKNLEYVVTCCNRAIQYEKGQVEQVGHWYIKQNITDSQRSLEKALIIHNDGQHELFGEKKECQKCKMLMELYESSEKSNRDYWIMTELFVMLHGSDECRLATDMNKLSKKVKENEPGGNSKGS